MRRVTALGGIFFKTKDKAALAEWYARHLGVHVQDWGGEQFWWTGDDGKRHYTVWSTFKDDTTYFAPSTKPYMVNFIVDDLHALLAELRAAGCAVDEKAEDSDYGKFGWVVDPDGTKLELWQPPLSQTGAGGHDIRHLVTIAAPASVVWPLVTTAEGFARWWTAEASRGEADAVELRAAGRASVERLRPGGMVLDARAEWLFETAESWSGTRLVFELEPDGDRTRLRLTHAGWRERNDVFTAGTTLWGELLFRHKRTAEGGQPGPLFSREGAAVRA